MHEECEPLNGYDHLWSSRNDLQVRGICEPDEVQTDNTSSPPSACTHSLEDRFSPHPAIQAVSVSLMNNSMQVTYDTHALTATDICAIVDDLGYEATEWETIQVLESTVPVNPFEREVQLRFEGANSSYVLYLPFGNGVSDQYLF